jgi:hypothetical protein
VGERSYTQVLAKALLEVSESNASSSSSTAVSFGGSMDDRCSSSIDVDRLAIDSELCRMKHPFRHYGTSSRTWWNFGVQ